MIRHALAGTALAALAATAPQACSTSGIHGAPKPHGVQVMCNVTGPEIKWASASAAVIFINNTKKVLTVSEVTVNVQSTVFTHSFSTAANLAVGPGGSGEVDVPQNRRYPGGCTVTSYRRSFQ